MQNPSMLPVNMKVKIWPILFANPSASSCSFFSSFFCCQAAAKTRSLGNSTILQSLSDIRRLTWHVLADYNCNFSVAICCSTMQKWELKKQQKRSKCILFPLKFDRRKTQMFTQKSAAEVYWCNAFLMLHLLTNQLLKCGDPQFDINPLYLLGWFLIELIRGSLRQACWCSSWKKLVR